MDTSLFHGNMVTARRIIYTPSVFAKNTLLYLQETGALQARKPHTSARKNFNPLILEIDGMMCSMCESHVNDMIRKNFKVRKVTSSHRKNEAYIVSEEIGELKLGKGTYRHSIDCSSPTANRTLTLPDASGTVALTSDIPTVTDEKLKVIGYGNPSADQHYPILTTSTNSAETKYRYDEVLLYCSKDEIENMIVMKAETLIFDEYGDKIIKDEEVLKIKNKNTIKNIKRRISLINRYKFHEDKLEKFIKFTHMNKIVSSTTNSIMKQ